jgi:hypothetical protein
VGGESLVQFVSGALTATFLVAATFFLRFWRTTRDRLFLGFAVAFLLLGLSRVMLSITAVQDEQRSYADLLRVLAFLLILVTIILKNIGGRPRP